MEPIDFQNILQQCLGETMTDKGLYKEISVLYPLSTHAHNSPKEIDSFILEKICNLCTKHLTAYFSGRRTLFLLPITKKEQASGLKSVLYWRRNPPVPVGNLFLQVISRKGSLEVEFQMEIDSLEPFLFTLPLSPQLQGLCAPKNKEKLPVLDPETHQLVFIDLEWISCFKGPLEKRQVELGQISEFSFLTGNNFYTSGYLKVDASYLKRVHKKLLEKMGISPEIMEERHSEGVIFVHEWQRVFLPMIKKAQEEDKKVVLLSYGTEDGKIFKKLFPPQMTVELIDVSVFFQIYHFGQMALLNGMGVSFTHDFSSAMDVRALYLIHEVFSQCETVEDSRNLQLALQLHKMYLQCLCPMEQEKLKIYHSLLCQKEETRLAFEKAVSMANDMVEAGFFSKEKDS